MPMMNLTKCKTENKPLISHSSAARRIWIPAHFVLMIIFFMIYGAVMVSFELNFPLEQEIVDNIFLSIVLISGIHFVSAVLLQIIGLRMMIPQMVLWWELSV